MALSKPHLLVSSTSAASTTSYEYFRNLEIKIRENAPLQAHGSPLGLHLDSEQRMAIGYGYDLATLPAATVVTDLSPYLAPGTSISSQQQAYLESYRSQSPLNLPGDPLNGKVSTKSQVLTLWSNIALASEAAATALLNARVASFESTVPLSLLPYSKERAAVISSCYNLGSIGPKLLTALQTDNRAEAWYEIRYNSNGGKSRANSGRGLAARRYREADTSMAPAQRPQQSSSQSRNRFSGCTTSTAPISIGRSEHSRQPVVS